MVLATGAGAEVARFLKVREWKEWTQGRAARGLHRHRGQAEQAVLDRGRREGAARGAPGLSLDLPVGDLDLALGGSRLAVVGADVSGHTSITADWAGGGIASTEEDLLRFQEALWSGKLVSEATLSAMQDYRHHFQKGIPGTQMFCAASKDIHN